MSAVRTRQLPPIFTCHKELIRFITSDNKYEHYNIKGSDMLSIIDSINHPLLSYIKHDPVRPEIPVEFRISNFRFVGALVENEPQAIVCVSLHDFIPESVEDLSKESESPDTAIFYTIWSYKAGAAKDLLFSIIKEIQHMFPSHDKALLFFVRCVVMALCFL